MTTEIDTKLMGEFKDALKSHTDPIQDRIDDIEASMKKTSMLSRATGTVNTARRDDLVGPEQKLTDALAQRGVETPSADEFRLGAVIGAMVLPKSSEAKNLSDLEERSLVGAYGSGGMTLSPAVAAMMFDAARSKARVIEAGAMTLPMADAEVYLPFIDDDPTPSWRQEATLVAKDAPVIGRCALASRTLAVMCKVSYELFEDLQLGGKSGASALAMIEGSLTQSVALGFDLAALRAGGGLASPTGIREYPGVNVTALGTGNGGSPDDYDELLDALAAVESANGEPTAILSSSRTVNTYRKLVTGISGDKTKLTPPARVAETPWLPTNQIPDNLTVGSSTDCSEIYVGDFRSLVIGVRPALSIQARVLDQTFADTMEVGILVWLRGDVAVVRPDHFEVIEGVRP